MTESTDATTPRSRRLDLLAVGPYLAVALMVTAGLWRNPNGRVLVENREDLFYEWMMANAARTVVELRDPLFTTWLNAPDGVNLMANTSMWAVTLPLVPVTLLLGAPVSHAMLVTVDLAGTAAAWYYVMSRHVVKSRLAAFVGGAVCGFCPGMIAQSTGHPNIAAQFVLPFFVLVVLRLRRPGSTLKRGLALAGLVVYQFFLNEELLLFTAMALGMFVLAYAGLRPAEIREAVPRTLKTFAITAAIAGAVLAYPMWSQFAGAQAYHGMPPEMISTYGTDLASYPAYARESLAGHAGPAGRLAQPPEQNAFFGWSLLALLTFIAVWLRREPVVRALATVGWVFALLSLGTHLELNHRPSIYLPWATFAAYVPLFDSIIPTRFSLIVWPVAALLLAILLDRLTPPEGGWPTPRLVGAVAIAAALLPVAPTPLTTAAARPTPRFFASGDWRHTIPPGGTVMCLPFGADGAFNAMRWQTATGIRYRLVHGIFIGPGAPPKRYARLGPLPSSTWRVFDETHDWSAPHPVSDADRDAVRGDLRRWRVDIVLVPDDHVHAAALRGTIEAILGPGQHVADVWVWRPAA